MFYFGLFCFFYNVSPCVLQGVTLQKACEREIITRLYFLLMIFLYQNVPLFGLQIVSNKFSEKSSPLISPLRFPLISPLTSPLKFPLIFL